MCGLSLGEPCERLYRQGDLAYYTLDSAGPGMLSDSAFYYSVARAPYKRHISPCNVAFAWGGEGICADRLFRECVRRGW